LEAKASPFGIIVDELAIHPITLKIRIPGEQRRTLVITIGYSENSLKIAILCMLTRHPGGDRITAGQCLPPRSQPLL
jgi:hypothetical protein